MESNECFINSWPYSHHKNHTVHCAKQEMRAKSIPCQHWRVADDTLSMSCTYLEFAEDLLNPGRNLTESVQKCCTVQSCVGKTLVKRSECLLNAVFTTCVQHRQEPKLNWCSALPSAGSQQFSNGLGIRDWPVVSSLCFGACIGLLPTCRGACSLNLH